MTYEEATAKVGELKARFDSPFDATDKAVIETLYFEVTRKRFVSTTCQQCYHDALIEIYLKLKKEKAMPKQCNYAMKAGFIISCPDFYHGKIFTNENLTDKVAHEYLTKYRPSTAQVEKLVTVMNDDYIDVREMMKLCGIVRRKTMQDSYIAPALTDGSIERKYPEQPNHPKQMYRLTEKAKIWKKLDVF